ncbi:unnamed protein product [Arctia plantaginis]|uniref:Alcohol dehydrogenase n=1 Tax=Arctia plantaginis TaxID=874455 RepID=A0A8S1BFQ4_ARCPL|nr:unnamed protein product [Arctia plantaginis]
MEALVFDPQSLSLKYHKYYPIPEISNDDEVIVRVDHTGVCGTDLHIIQGDFPVRNDRPFPLGHEFSGYIHAVGKNSTFKLGQRVAIDPNSGCQLCDCCRSGKYQHCLTAGLNSYIGIFKDGGWAKYCKVLQQQVYALPDGITNKQACFAEPLSCVAHSFNRAGPLKVGEKILIIGAGIIGNLFASALYYQGHRNVTVSEKIEKRLDIFRRMSTGFRLINPDILEQEKMLYDVIIDCTGGNTHESLDPPEPRKKCYVRLEPTILHGVLPQVILFRGVREPGSQGLRTPVDLDRLMSSINLYQIFDKELTIIGVKTNSFSFPTAIEWIKVMGERYLEYHKLGVKTYWLSEYETALADLKTGRVAKIIFKTASLPLM